MKKILLEFKTFALRGNVVDLAVGIIIGASFNGLVKSIIDDIIMPPIGWMLGGVDFSNFFFVLGSGEYDSVASAKSAGAATINYGLFVNVLISFLITAWVVFLMVKLINKLRLEQAKKPQDKVVPPPEEVILLREIRDSLKK